MLTRERFEGSVGLYQKMLDTFFSKSTKRDAHSEVPFSIEFHAAQESDLSLPAAASVGYIGTHHRRLEASRFGHTCPSSRVSERNRA